MSLRNSKNISNSGLILEIADLETKKHLEKWLFKTKNYKKPTLNKNNAVSFSNTNDFEDFIKNNYKSAKTVKISSEIPTNLVFENTNVQLYYLSVLLTNSYNSNIEYNLIVLLQDLFNRSKDRSFLKYCNYKITKKTLACFLQSNVWNFSSIKSFVTFLAPKLVPNIIEIWFENDFEFIDELFRNLDVIKIGPNTPFNSRLFDHLLQFKNFKKSVFGYNSALMMNKDFILQMKKYINRGDFEYYYKQNGIKDYISSLPKLKDSCEFDFFNNFDQKDKIYSNLLKIRKYQERIGHNIILNLFISNNLTQICGYINDYDVVLPIIEDTILFNSLQIKNNMNKESKVLNDTIFDLLKKNEDKMASLIGFFYNPKDQILQNLIIGHYDFTVKEASEYINIGFEEELISFYKNKHVNEMISIIDDWNSEFFLKLFSNISFNIDDAVLVINFIQRSSLVLNLQLVSLIYDKILNIKDINIFNNLRESLKPIYCLRHSEFALEYISRTIQSQLDINQASSIYELISSNPSIKLDHKSINDKLIKIVTCKDIDTTPEDIIDQTFYTSFILKEKAYCIFTEVFESYCDHILKTLSKEELMSLHEKNYNFAKYFSFKECDLKKIELTLKNEINFGLYEKISFVMSYNLSNNYLCYILFDKILEILTSGTSSQRILLLTYINPSILTKEHIHKFINVLIPLLNSSNITICNLSKLKFNQINVETKEIQNILPEIVQTFLNRDYFKVFIKSFKAIQFNNYLCFNSLNLLLQLFLRCLDTYNNECFDILKRIINIMKDRDIRLVSKLIFSNMAAFIVKNSYSTQDALEVASQFCLYTSFEDYEYLLKNLNSLRISNYLVEILKIKGDTALNDKIICYFLGNIDFTTENDLCSSINPVFIATACELREFSKYLNVFLPLIKKLFINEKIETRQIACKAIKSIMNSSDNKEYKQSITDFFVDCCVDSDHNIKLQCLDITTYLPIIFILRHDQHSLVKKKAYDVWKSLVFNTNKELKLIYSDILNYIKFKESKTFNYSLKAMLSEMSLKYSSYIENYLKECNDIGIKTFIFIETVKNGKFLDLATDFCKDNFSLELFNALSKNINLQNKILNDMDKSHLYELCSDNTELALLAFNQLKNPVYIELLSTSQKTDLIKSYQQTNKTSIDDENIIIMLQSMESCRSIEDLLLRIHPIYSYYYILDHKIDFGGLTRIFERVFDSCYGLDKLVVEENANYLKYCSFDHVDNKLDFLLIMINHHERLYFEKAVQIIKDISFVYSIEQHSLYELLGYLFRNMLLSNRKNECADCINIFYKKWKNEMGYFKTIAESINI